MRRFRGLRLTEALPDETIILNFWHLLEKHDLGEGLFEEINAHLASRGHRLRTGGSDEEGQAVVFRDEGAHRG